MPESVPTPAEDTTAVGGTTPATAVTAADPSSRLVLAAPVEPSAEAAVRLHPLAPGAARITGGFWAQRQERNHRDALIAGHERLEDFGTLENFRRAARGEGEAQGMIFQDSDAYKWLEAVAYEAGRSQDEELLRLQREVTAIVAAAQAPDGYLNAVHTLRHTVKERYTNLAWNHELYCYGHLMQAAVAQQRCTGDDALMNVALRILDHLQTVFGEGRNEGVPGHPEIEMALVELYRQSGRRDALDLARFFLDHRGLGSTEGIEPDPSYFSDRVPVREAQTVEGHAVRALYLAAGATDLAVEDADAELLAQQRRLFATTLATKTYVTGGMGSRWDWEAFGAPFELGTDRGYAETCAAIAAIQWAWRLLLATGDALYAESIERILYNAFLPGVSLAGTEFFYVNSLQLRDGDRADENRSIAHGRRGWFDCACCPPNIMRMLASLDIYAATADERGLHLHQYASGSWTATVDGDPLTVEVRTEYPRQGAVRLRITQAPSAEASLFLRIPSWSTTTRLVVAGQEQEVSAGTVVEVRRRFVVGDEVELDLDLTPRFTRAPHRVDASRGALALERGPLVYALEQADQTGPERVDDALVDSSAPVTEHPLEELDGVIALDLPGWAEAAPVVPDVEAGVSPWPYPSLTAGSEDAAQQATPHTWRAIPYYAWANREIGPMRVWLPEGSSRS